MSKARKSRRSTPQVEAYEPRLLLSGGLNMFGTATPANPSESDDSAVEVGVRFQSEMAGTINGIRFYQSAENTGTHVVDLWDNSGNILATASSNDQVVGWHEIDFSSPITILPNTLYVASYHTDSGHYADDTGVFANDFDASPLHAPADAEGQPNGVYAYGEAQSFPTNTWEQSNYYVDVDFHPSLAVDSVAPQLDATGVSRNTTVAAHFNVALDTSTISSAKFTLAKPDNTTVSATVSYSSLTHTLRLTPSSPLDYNTTYTATVLGSPNGVSDIYGDQMSANVSWSFTTVANQNGPAPTVSSAYPTPNSTGVSTNPTIYAVFTTELDSATVNTTNVTMMDVTHNSSVTVSVSYGQETESIIIVPQGMGLLSNTTYSITLHTGIKSLGGVPLASDYVWYFTTA